MKIEDIKKHAASRDAEQGNEGIKYIIYEWLSTYLVKLLMYTSITANQITVIGILFPLLSMVLFSFGLFWINLLAVGILYLGELMDAVDGSLARSKNQCTKLQSNFLGNIYHSVPYAFLFVGIGMGVYASGHGLFYLLCGVFAGMFQMTIAFMRFLSSNVMLKNKYKFDSDEKKIFNNKSFIKKVFEFPMKNLRLILLFSVLFNVLHYIIVFYYVFNFVKLFGYIYTIYESFKKMEEK